MVKNKLSLVDKKLIRNLFLLVLMQLLIIFAFIHMMGAAQLIDIEETKQNDITVDDIYYFRVPKEYWLFVVEDDTKYLFMSRSTSEEYSVNELYNAISTGDSLSLIYYESKGIVFKKVNVIVDARTETEIYRTLEDYNCGKQGVHVFVVILFAMIELIFVGIVIVYVWLNYSIFKGVYRKIKNCQHNQIKKSH